MPQDFSQWSVVIPARLGSQRLPRKPLLDLAGKPLIVRVYENLAPLRQAGALIIVATDSAEIISVAEAHGIPACMTQVSHQSGTDRCYEVAKTISRPFLLNVQGDEPFVDCEVLAKLMQAVENNPHSIGTLATHSVDRDAFYNPNVVKVVMDGASRALFFSRASIPYNRQNPDAISFYRHCGVYAFPLPLLRTFCELPKSRLEFIESLEQMRALEHGIPFIVVEQKRETLGIDTGEDLRQAQTFYP